MEAVAANEAAVISLTDYAAVYDVLEAAAPALQDRALLNLTSATPEEARAGARWAAGRGAVQLTGGVNSLPSGIGARTRGTPRCSTRSAWACSGPPC